MKKKRINTFLICLLLATHGFSQTKGYRYTALIDPVKKEGFYNILITPAINAHLKTDYTDFRIINSAGKWVPHLVRYPKEEQTATSVLWDLGIVKNSGNTVSTEIILKTPSQSLSNITFSMRNSGAERFGTLTGSDDSIRWFMIYDSMPIRPLVSTPQESEFSFNFRPTTYQFYKLTIDNKGKAPYAIKGATTRRIAVQQGSDSMMLEPFQNPAVAISQQDSAKTSYIKLQQRGNFHVDEIELIVDGSAWFNREVQLYLQVAPGQKKNVSTKILSTFIISNSKSLRFKVPVFSDALFYLAIANADNLPLKVQAVNTYCGRRVATVYLENNGGYSIMMDNAAALTPSYDLQLADLNKRQSLPFIGTGSITSLPGSAVGNVAWYENKWLLWSLIIASAALLCFFTFRLTKDLGTVKE